MATSVVFPRVKFFADNGQPLIGGRIHTYVAGSSTRARTYVDAAKAQPNTNPIVLDSRGEAAIYLAEGVEYKFVIEDRKGALIMTQEPVYGAVWPNAAEWPSDATLAYRYMVEAKAAAEAAVLDFAPFDSYAQFEAALPELANGIAEVSRDETRLNQRVRYRVTDGVPDFLVSMDYFQFAVMTPAGDDPAGGFLTLAQFSEYAGPATRIKYLGDGLGHEFAVDPSDATTPSNYGTTVVDSLGRRWKRQFEGFADVRMFGAKPISATATDGFDSTQAIKRAVSSGHSVVTGGGLRYAVKACRVPSFKIVCAIDLLTLPGAVPSEFWSPMTIGAHGDMSLTEHVTFDSVRVNGNRLLNGDDAVGASEDGGRHGFRVIGNARHLRFNNCEADYCGSYGFFFYRGLNTAPIPFQDVPTIEDVKLINCKARWNKSHGGAADAIKDFEIIGGEYTYNGLDYETDPGALTLAGNAYSNAWDFEGYGIGSYIENVTVRGADLRFNACTSILIQDPVDAQESRFKKRRNINLLDNLYDRGQHPLRQNPNKAIIVTGPYEKWSNGSLYDGVRIIGGQCNGEIDYACVDDLIIDVVQNGTGASLGLGAWSNVVRVVTDSPQSFTAGLNLDVVYRRILRNDKGTKTLTLGAASGAVSNGTCTLHYERIGNIVYCSVRVDIIDKGTAGGVAILGNLPWAQTFPVTGAFRYGSEYGTYSVSGTDIYVWGPDNALPYSDGEGFALSFFYMTQ